MRLTKKGKTIPYAREYADADSIRKITRKLGQIEDIEDELGIDLVTLFKAMNEGFYYLYGDAVLFADPENEECGIECYGRKYGIMWAGVHAAYTSDYGKTWALTKEELEEKR